MEIITEIFPQNFYPIYYILKIITFIISLIIFIKVFSSYAKFMRIKADDFQNYSKLILNSRFIKKNETSIKKLVIALPFDSEIYAKKLINHDS